MFAQLLNDYKLAMKEKQDIKKSVLNFLIAQIKNKKIELLREPTDEEIIALIKKEVKTLNEAIGYLEKANKADQIAEETAKRIVLESYLPARMDEAQTKSLIENMITKLKIIDLKTQKGLLMKELMAKYKMELDTALVNKVITDLIESAF